LNDILQRHLSQLELSELDSDSGSGDIQAVLAEFRTDVDALIRQAQQLTGPNPKLVPFSKLHDKSGAFRVPRELTEDDLSPEFSCDINHNVLKAIGLVENARSEKLKRSRRTVE
jgi:hypothetical protein